MELNKCLGCMENYQGTPCPHCGYDPNRVKGQEYTLPPQTILAGKYLVGRMLGQGGFGITYIGWDIALERKVAIKEYYPNGLVGRSQTSRVQLVWYSGPLAEQARKDGMDAFLREARKMTKVSAIPRVVQVRDLFYENGTAYIVMDFVEGRTLKKQLEAKGPMTWNQLKPILLPAAQAMEQVHQAGLIHRDLSPDNLMLTPDGDVRILDLGAAKDLKKGSGVSSMQVAKGGFSPPEQYFQQGSSGPYTDVYALAATAYYALTGKVPVPAIDRMNKDSLRWDLPELAGAPENVVHALRKAMSLRSQDRPQTMGEFAALLTQKGHTLKKGLPKPAIIGLSAIAAVCLIVGAVGLLGGTKKSTPKTDSSAVSGVTASSSPAETYPLPTSAPGSSAPSSHPTDAEPIEETAPATDTSPGSGTLADPYKISSAADLEKLRTDSKSHFVLAKNLDLSGVAFAPIQEFSGTLDGGGYTISGLNPSFNKGESYWNGALFFKLTKNAVVKNLGVKCSLTTSKEKSNGAGIAVSNEGLIQNCTVEIKARGCYALGGITQNNVYCGTIQDCSVTIVAQDCKFVGGIGEYQAGTIRGCQAKIELTDATSIGGIAYANAGTMENCTASGTVTTKYTNGILAGVVGENISGGQVSNCTSSVTSSGTSLPAIG